ncbi:hypothetical protein D9613_010967 [Agrocybe pediades]|uniref:Uncharacterized protein n=1 Tax=Agrocybe pediades TaxID=84607 RepID=A0A8H4VM55_9AGAR|nr:hypothetical protein D9613_010967 [Agrocybe pediades]
MTVPQLPVELIYEIVSWCANSPGQPTLRNLCLVSWRFRHVVQPLLLQSVVLGNFTTVVKKKAAQLNALSAQACRPALHARSLRIDLGGIFDSACERIVGGDEQIQLTLKVKPAIQAFRRVDKVLWTLCDVNKEPPWTQYAVIDALRTSKPKELVITVSEDAVTPTIGSLSDVHRLSVDYRGSYSAAKDVLQYGVARLASKSPNMTHLEIASRTCSFEVSSIFNILNSDNPMPLPLEYLGVFGSWVDPSVFSSPSVLRHLQRLRSIALYENGKAGNLRNSSTSIWDTFQQENITLRSISTDSGSALGDAFVNYLSSFHGLQRLQLGLSAEQTDTPNPEALLNCLITQHAPSLLELKVATQKSPQWMWPFSEEMKSRVSGLTRLTDFGVTLCVANDEQAENDVEAAVHSLIDYADSLPNLEELLIYQSGVVSQEGYSRYQRFHHPPTRVNEPVIAFKSVHRAIGSFRSKGLSNAAYRIVVHDSVYARRPNAEGTFSFVLI